MAIHVDVVAELERRSVEKAAAQLEKSFDQYNVPIGADVKADQIKAAAEKIKREFSDIRAEIKVDVDKSAVSQINNAKNAINDVQKSARGATDVIQELGKVAFRTSRGLIAIGAPIAVEGLLQLAEVGTAATQTLWLLPAAATAAGAAIGTLALATSGFADTIKDIRDPKKFAADIQMLSPAAQQAALSIQNLLPEFDKLKNATQDALFAGMGEQINRLATTYLPTIQNMTTSIAGSFNSMLGGIADELMTPQMQATLQTTFSNIAQTFQNLAPAARDFAKAFADISAVGSSFLPGFATGIANAASEFATFISNARESGQLATWIQQGIDAVKNLADAAWQLIQIWYRVFGPDANSGIDNNNQSLSALQQTLQSYNADLTKTSDIIGLVMLDGETWSRKWNEEMTSMQGPLGALRDGILDIPEAMGVVINGVVDMANQVNHGINWMAKNAHDALSQILPGDQGEYKPIGDIPYVGRHGQTGPDAKGSWGDWGGYQNTNGPFGGVGQPGLGGDPNAQRQRRGAPPVGSNIPGASPYPGPFAVPAAPPDTGSKPSERDQKDAIIAGLPPSQWQVDPFAGMPGLPATGPGGGPGQMTQSEFVESQRKIISEAHDLEQATKERLALEKSNTATQREVDDAKWKEVEAGWSLQKAQQDLVDKATKTTRDVTSGMNDLGAALDPDFGLSKGLAGLAENLVKFVGNLAMAPQLAKWDQQMQASPIKGGYGLLGINGANNIAAGLSPLLGNPLAGGGDTSTPPAGLGGLAQTFLGGSAGTGPVSTTPSVYGPAMATTQGGVYPSASAAAKAGGYTSDAALLANVPRGVGQYDSVTKDLSKGLVDCASGVEDLVNIMDGKSTAGGSLWTGNASSVLPGMGFQRGMGGPGDFRIGYNSGHMQATLPGGTNVNYGSTSAIQQGGVSGSAGALDPSFTDHWFRPVVGGGGSGWGGGATAPAPAPAPAAAPSGSGGKYSGQVPAGTPPGVAAILGNMGFTPPAAGGGGWGGPTPLPQLGTGGGQGPFLPATTPSMLGGGLGAAPAAGGAGFPSVGAGLGQVGGTGATQIGGVGPGGGTPNPGGGGIGITPGGSIDTALNLAASAFPGVGQAAATGAKLASRAIQYGGQLAGIGVSGLMETFLPTGGSELANSGWLQRIVGGLAGASPQLPNTAGGKGGQGQGKPYADAPGALTPEQASQANKPFANQSRGDTNIVVNNNRATEDGTGRDIAAHQQAMYSMPGPR